MDLKERLHNHLIQIVRDRNPYLASAGHFYVQQYIREELGHWGTVEIDDFAVRGRIYHNFILDLPPSKKVSKQGLPPIFTRKSRRPELKVAHTKLQLAMELLKTEHAN